MNTGGIRLHVSMVSKGVFCVLSLLGGGSEGAESGGRPGIYEGRCQSQLRGSSFVPVCAVGIFTQ